MSILLLGSGQRLFTKNSRSGILWLSEHFFMQFKVENWSLLSRRILKLNVAETVERTSVLILLCKHPYKPIFFLFSNVFPFRLEINQRIRITMLTRVLHWIMYMKRVEFRMDKSSILACWLYLLKARTLVKIGLFCRLTLPTSNWYGSRG